ncbi:MAG: hypothetical protein RBG13Loki_4050 [Promethearchaeota archaeon CR_4]|nr:MAG: hypothetical protein RBG13Loki_4050 [Candidatus Lokiarchaeota archaeon CR_4]
MSGTLLEGFAAIMKELLRPVNKNPKFSEKFSAINLKILLVATDMYPAALVHADYGEVKVSSVSQEACKEWKKTGARCLIQCTTNQFLAISMGKLNPAKAWLTRQIKIRGVRNVKKFYDMIVVGMTSKRRESSR